MLLRPLLQSAEAGIADASSQLDRSAAQVTRLSGASSAAESAATVNISAQARGASSAQAGETHGGLEGAVVAMSIAKYAFIANLRTLQTGDEMAKELNKLGQKR
jgi:hypothetical protein